MHRPNAGLTIIETLVGLVLLAVLIAAVVPLLTVSMRNNAGSRVRTSATAVAESWLDRYRSGQEPLTAGGACTALSTGVGVTCRYPANFNYATDDVASHAADATAMAARFKDFDTTITAIQINTGVNTQLWQVQARVTPKLGTAGGGQGAVLTTRFTQ